MKLFRLVTMLVALTAVVGVATANAQTKVTYLLTSATPDVAQAPHSSVPAALGYWKEAGLDVEVQPFSGSTGAVQLVLAGSAHVTMATVEPLIIGRQKGARIVAMYNHVREPIYTIAVPADSPITSVKQLRGKTIGVLSLASGAVPFAKAMLRGEGFDPEKDVNWVAIGQGAQAAHAVLAKRVDALAYWDWGYAVMEIHGARFRHFTSDATAGILSLGLVANEDWLETHAGVAAKLAQGIAKAALFTLTNPEAAVRLHWERYPASKPTGVPEEKALADAIHVLKARADKYRIDNRKVPKWGAFTREEWVATQDFLYDNGMISRRIDAGQYYTDALLDRINDFDAAKVIEQAKNWK
jgi:NitT/TauT family transport system substrate-binding protein